MSNSAEAFVALKKRVGNLDFWLTQDQIVEMEQACRDFGQPAGIFVTTPEQPGGGFFARSSFDSGIRFELTGVWGGTQITLDYEAPPNAPSGSMFTPAGPSCAEAAEQWAAYLNGGAGIKATSDGGTVIVAADTSEGATYCEIANLSTTP